MKHLAPKKSTEHRRIGNLNNYYCNEPVSKLWPSIFGHWILLHTKIVHIDMGYPALLFIDRTFKFRVQTCWHQL